MTDRTELLKSLVPKIEDSDTTVVEPLYEVSSLREAPTNQLTDVEMLVVGDYSASLPKEDIMAKYGLTKSQLNSIMRNPSAQKLRNELAEEKHQEMKSRLAGVLSEGVEQYVDLIRSKIEKGESPEKVMFYLFGTSSMMEVYEKLGKMEKKDEGNVGTSFQSFFSEIKIQK